MLLVTALLTMLLPAHALAANVTTVNTEAELRDAVAGASDAVTIELGADIYLQTTIVVEEGKNVTLDLKGHVVWA